MKKNILVAALMLFSITISAQTVEELTPQQRLEKAKREAAEAKQAIKAAKLAAKQEEKALKLKEKEAQNAAKLEAKVAKMEAEAQRLKAQAAEERARLETQRQAAKPAPVESKPIVKQQVQSQTVKPAVQMPKKEDVIEKQGWAVPKQTEPQTETRTTTIAPTPAPIVDYLAGAVPEVDGKVVFTINLDIPEKSAEDIYNTTYSFLSNLTVDAHQRKNENSTVALVNKQEGKIVARLNEWLEFSRTSLSLDRAKFNYVAIATCSEGKLHVTIERLSYVYEEKRPGGFRLPAEELISDQAALNKKGKLIKSSQKFRISTIDRIREIFNNLTQTFNR